VLPGYSERVLKLETVIKEGCEISGKLMSEDTEKVAEHVKNLYGMMDSLTFWRFLGNSHYKAC
jgi:hypothetical protein